MEAWKASFCAALSSCQRPSDAVSTVLANAATVSSQKRSLGREELGGCVVFTG